MNLKRLISIAFFLLFLFNYLGYYFTYFLADHKNRAEMQSHLVRENVLETIRVHKSGIKNIVLMDEGREMLLEGQMYDIKNKTIEGEYILFHCKHDKRESRMLAGLNSHTENNSGDKKQDTSKNPIKDLFLCGHPTAFIISTPLVFKSHILNFISHISSPLPPPPPEDFRV